MVLSAAHRRAQFSFVPSIWVSQDSAFKALLKGHLPPPRKTSLTPQPTPVTVSFPCTFHVILRVRESVKVTPVASPLLNPKDTLSS